MVSPNTSFTELTTSTMRNRTKDVVDVVSKHNALYKRLMDKKRVTLLGGGSEIVRSIDFAENGTFQWYSAYDTLAVQPSEVFTTCNYAWKQAALHVTENGPTIRANSGKEAMFNLVKGRVSNALRTFGNNMSLAMYSDGTTPNAINGLQLLAADAGTGTVGGINSTTYTWWKNVVQSAAAPLQGGGAITPSATTIEDLMLPLYIELSRGSDKPDVIVSSNDYYTFYERSLTPQRRYTSDEKTANGGFRGLEYKDATIYHDGGTKGGGIPNAHMYFLNTDFLEVVVQKDANMTRMDDKMSINQDAVAIPFLWQGAFLTTNRAFLGVLKS